MDAATSSVDSRVFRTGDGAVYSCLVACSGRVILLVRTALFLYAAIAVGASIFRDCIARAELHHVAPSF